jgi:hypothetical protein
MKHPHAAQMVLLAGSVGGLLIAAAPAFATGTVNDGNYDIYITSSGTPSSGTDPVAGTYTFAGSSTFAGYTGGPLVIPGVATISGGLSSFDCPGCSTNPGTGFPGNAGISNWIFSGNGSVVTINFNSARSDFGFLWGSIDGTNTVTFYSGADGTGTAIASYTGTELVGYGKGAEYYDAAGSFVNWAADGSADDFLSVVMTDPSACCFEVVNFATNSPTTISVPEPTTLSLMVGGLLMGWAARRRHARA